MPVRSSASEPFGLSQSTAEHRKSFDAFARVGAIELTVADNAADPTVLYFHGGGYVVGSARTGTHLAAELARRSGGRALSVDYRLAPEHPYPAAVEYGLAAYAGLLRSGVSPAQVLDDVDVTLQVAPEGTYVFQLHFGVLDEADEALDEVAPTATGGTARSVQRDG